MKHIIILGVILVSIIALSEAYVAQIIQDENPAYRGYCKARKYPGKGYIYRTVGSVWRSGPCESSECKRANRRQLKITTRGCAPIQVPAHCTPVPMDPSKPFGQCCPTAICP